MSLIAIERDTEDQDGYIPQVQNLLSEMGHSSQIISSDDIMAGALSDGFNAITFPGGLGAFYGLRKYGDRFRKCIQFYVASGIGYLGICGGAYVAGTSIPYLFTTYARVSLGLIDVAAEQPPVIKFLNEYREMQDERVLALCNISNRTHPIISGHEGEQVKIVYSGGPVLDNIGPSVQRLVYFSNEVLPAGTVAAAAARFGRGRVVICSPHPEAPIGKGVDVGEPCLKWLYQRMVEYVLEPETSVEFPIYPWEKAAPMPTPIWPLMGMAATVGLIIGGARKSTKIE